jgi:hypothetical protein
MTLRKKPIRVECLGLWGSYNVSRPLTAPDLPFPCTALFMRILRATFTKDQLRALTYIEVDGPSTYYKFKRGEILRIIYTLYSYPTGTQRPLTADESELIRLATRVAMKKRTLENNGSLYVPWEVAAACGSVLTYHNSIGPPEAADYENAGLFPYCEHSKMVKWVSEVRDIYFAKRTIVDHENEALLRSLEPRMDLVFMGDPLYREPKAPMPGRLVSAFEDPEEYDYDDDAYHNMDT